jgi:ribosomal protein S18 acetylase RimI-like enzyme
MWVDPRARGRGVGDALVGKVVQWARAQGARRVVLDVRESNLPAIGLYARHGFCDVGRASGPNDPHPERRMTLELT